MSDKTEHIEVGITEHGIEAISDMGSATVVALDNATSRHRFATLTIHKGERERVLTESEVAAMEAEIPEGFMIHAGGNAVEALRFMVDGHRTAIGLVNTLEAEIERLRGTTSYEQVPKQALDDALAEIADKDAMIRELVEAGNTVQARIGCGCAQPECGACNCAYQGWDTALAAYNDQTEQR